MHRVLAQLLAGNRRFRTGRTCADRSVARRKELTAGQFPRAAIVACSDSRVTPEVLFDQDLGSLFVVRTAGHVLSDVEIGTIEFAVERLPIALVVVLGHSRCGAVTATVLDEPAEGARRVIVDAIRPAVVRAVDPAASTEDQIQAAVCEHVARTLRLLTDRSPLVAARVSAGDIAVVGSIYDLATGVVAVLPPEP